MLVVGADWKVGQVLWSILWLGLWIVFIFLLFVVFADIFRSHDLSGWAKAFWVIGVILFPMIGILVYLLVRGGSMHERAVKEARLEDQQFRTYVRQVTGSSSSAAEIAKLADLRKQGLIDDAEFEALKAKVVATPGPEPAATGS